MSNKIFEANNPLDQLSDLLKRAQQNGTQVVGIGPGGASINIGADGSSTMSGDVHDMSSSPFGQKGRPGEDGVIGVGHGGEDEGAPPEGEKLPKKKPPPGIKKPKGPEQPAPGQAKQQKKKKKKKQPGPPGQNKPQQNPSLPGGKEGGGGDAPDEKDRITRPSKEDLKKAQAAASKHVDDALNDKKETKDKELPQAGKKSKDKSGASSSKGGAGKDKGSGAAFDYSKVKPTMSWKQILAKLITAPISHAEDSYLKPSRKTITSMTQAAQIGSAAVKPGEKISEFMRPKLVIVVDGSGSMQGAIALAFANIVDLFRKNPLLAEETFFLVKFSGAFETYLCSVKYKSAVYLKELKPTKELDGSILSELKKDKSLEYTFTHVESGGTMFVDPMVSEIDYMMSKDHNVLLFTDTDITAGQNFVNLKNLYKKHKGKFFVIMDERSSWEYLVKEMGGVPGNFSHM